MKLAALTAILLLLSLSCRESLPVRVEPGDLFEGRIQGTYILTSTEHTVWICMSITNAFDETIQTRLTMQGEITVTLASDPTVKRTFQLTAANIRHGPYDPQTKMLTLDPDSSLQLAVVWDFRDDNGTDVREAYFHFLPDPNCPGRFRCRETLYLEGHTKVIDRGNEAIFPRTAFTRSFADVFVSPKVCTPASFESQCY